jgi:hypothetical protein
MTKRTNAGKPADLHEIIADIAYAAGIARHYSGDSRADMAAYIAWAGEFARGFTQEQEDAGEYMELVEAFADKKLEEAGNCDAPPPLLDVVTQLAALGESSGYAPGSYIITTGQPLQEVMHAAHEALAALRK